MAAILLLVSTVTNLTEGFLIKRYNAKHQKGGFLFTAGVAFFSMLFF